MAKKYIYACIRVPMEVLPDGTYEPCSDYTKISFERCDELPNIGPLDNNNLAAVLSSFAVQELIPKHLVKRGTRNATYNSTFKLRQGKNNRYSVKNRPISLEIGDGLLNSLTPVQGESGSGDHTYPNSSSF